MRRSPSNNQSLEPQYDIIVRSQREGLGDSLSTKVYRAAETISDDGADSMLRRGTRFRKVQILVNGSPQGPHFVPMDLVAHFDLVPEHACYFFTVLEAGFVPANPVLALDILENTSQAIRRERFVTSGSPLQILRGRSTTLLSPATTSMGISTWTILSGERSSIGHLDNVAAPRQDEQRDSAHLNECPRRHYRIVFQEIGTPVHGLRSFVEVLRALEGGSEGLYALHLGGRVHGDVSSGNIVLVRGPEGSDGRGIILDLEHVKDVANPGRSHGVKTGTLAFMAVEVREWNYIYAPRYLRGQRVYPPPFRHNVLHDLESIWWILMFMMFFLVHPEGQQTRRQYSRYQFLFESPNDRRSFWDSSGVFDDLTSYLTKASSSGLLDIMFQWGEDLRKEYVKSYSQSNFYDIDTESLDKAHLEQKTIFGRLCGDSKGYPWLLHILSDLYTS